MSNSSASRRKPAYDPARQWGLKPAEGADSGGVTYVVSGHVVGGSSADPRTMHIVENMGREGQAKAQRKMAGRDADRALKALLERDKEGMRAVMKARDVAKDGRSKGQDVKGGGTGKGKGKGKEKGGEEKRKRKAQDSGEESGPEVSVAKHSYKAEVIKQLGFDPAVKAGHRTGGDLAMHKKVWFVFGPPRSAHV